MRKSERGRERERERERGEGGGEKERGEKGTRERYWDIHVSFVPIL